MYLTLCINAENRDEGVENHSEGTQQKTRPHSTEVRQHRSMTNKSGLTFFLSIKYLSVPLYGQSQTLLQ